MHKVKLKPTEMESSAAAFSEISVDMLQRCEALVDGKKINEAVDLLNAIGKSAPPLGTGCWSSVLFILFNAHLASWLTDYTVEMKVTDEKKEEEIKTKEQAILLLGKVLAKHGFAEGRE